MAGVKGRSGRKPQKIEIHDGLLHEKCSKWLFDAFDTFSKKDKRHTAIELVKKFGMAKVHATGNFTFADMAKIAAEEDEDAATEDKEAARKAAEAEAQYRG